MLLAVAGENALGTARLRRNVGYSLLLVGLAGRNEAMLAPDALTPMGISNMLRKSDSCTLVPDNTLKIF